MVIEGGTQNSRKSLLHAAIISLCRVCVGSTKRQESKSLASKQEMYVLAMTASCIGFIKRQGAEMR